MARNFFGGRRGMVNPLAALLMQQQEQEQPLPQTPKGQFWYRPGMEGDVQSPSAGVLRPPDQAPRQPLKMGPVNLESALDLGFKSNPALGIPFEVGKRVLPKLPGAAAQGANILGEALGSGRVVDQQEPQRPQPPVAPPAAEGGAQEPAPEPEQSLFQRLDAEKAQPNPSMQGFGAVLPPGIQGAVEETVKQYGLAQQDYDKAMLAMKKEFQDTPEIDEALSNAKQALDQAKMGRKQPSAWDFIAIALLNLSGQDPRLSADMVLGMGDQQRREERLEDRVMGLEGAQIQGRMGGRRDFRQSLLQQQLAEAEAQQRAQMEANKERRWQADFGLRQQDQTSSLLRALSGQEAETQRFAPESEAGKKAGVSRDLLKKLMQMDDSSLQRMLQQRQQAPPQDMRQSRMFGRPGGGLA